MTEFRKTELLTALQEIDDMVTLSLASITYFLGDRDLKNLSQNWMMHFGRVWNLAHLSNELKNDETKHNRLNDYTWTIKKFFLREPLRLLE